MQAVGNTLRRLRTRAGERRGELGEKCSDPRLRRRAAGPPQRAIQAELAAALDVYEAAEISDSAPCPNYAWSFDCAEDGGLWTCRMTADTSHDNAPSRRSVCTVIDLEALDDGPVRLPKCVMCSDGGSLAVRVPGMSGGAQLLDAGGQVLLELGLGAPVDVSAGGVRDACRLYTSPSPRDERR